MVAVGHPTVPWEQPDAALQWALRICEALGINTNDKVTPNSVTALVCWICAENGQSGNNPLGSTLPWKNSKTDESSSVGLQRYDTREDGVAATAKTILNHPEIAQPLKDNADYVKTARAIASSNWGTNQLVVTIAVSIKGSGGAGGTVWKQYASKTVKATGHSAWRSIPFVGDSIAGAQSDIQGVYDTVTGGFGAIGDFVGAITDPHNWYRAAQILLGAILLFVGAVMLFRNSSAGQALAAAPIPSMKGKGKGAISAGATEVTPEVAAA